MFDDTHIRQLAAELHQSEKSRVQVEHFSKRYPGMTIEDGYRHQPRLGGPQARRRAHGAIGHKIGLTSRAMQISSQITEPDYGTLLDDMFFEPGRHPRGSASLRRAWRWSWPLCSRKSSKAAR
jgi:2-oxo-hept-3-ene-1,7-dioate hydratase